MPAAKDPKRYEELQRMLAQRNKGNKYHFGKHHSEDAKRKMALARIGKPSYNKGKHGLHVGWNKGLTKETDERVKKISLAHKGRPKSEEQKRNLSIAKKGKPNPKCSETKKRLFADGKLVAPNKGKKFSLEWRKKLSETRKQDKYIASSKINLQKIDSKKNWQNPIYREKVIRNSRKAMTIKPNKPEKFIDSIIQTNFPNEWHLNVHGDTVLNGKVPDWINCNGQKKVILFNGIYWHLWKQQKENPELTKEMVEERERKSYNELGFDVLHIWEDDIKDIEQVKQKIDEFIGANHECQKTS